MSQQVSGTRRQTRNWEGVSCLRLGTCVAGTGPQGQSATCQAGQTSILSFGNQRRLLYPCSDQRERKQGCGSRHQEQAKKKGRLCTQQPQLPSPPSSLLLSTRQASPSGWMTDLPGYTDSVGTGLTSFLENTLSFLSGRTHPR